MFRQLYVGATGMNALEQDMVVITNNVSNSKTTAFKKSRAEMENLFPQVLDEAVSEIDSETKRPAGIEFGSGVRVVSTPKDFAQGTPEITSNPLDLMIQGEGFFTVRMPDGTLAYTRAGNFHRDDAGNIVDPNGHILEPSIVIPQDVTGIRVSADGGMYVKITNAMQENLIGQLSISKFSNPAGLESIGQNLYRDSLSSGEAAEGVPGKDGFGTIAQFSLEGSNVDIVDEMMKMIITQRAFDIISKSIQVGENMLRSAIEIAKVT
ncbi:MAG: flagellar basal-body rod protein FlgG [Candidatus Margulisiibacteriota bacterium]|nr:MAG: flagellar basal-body rod protein FlgG [Candidatus Margulisbacteria bacterium GWD2_39_127]OGI01038.1 MAG: flagellar basal-body rod protein FlgG [Candidatus Margulisbacteria bacterium GWF2_38_17]OGI09567.1 MAG: flagellar basal-body rod protein FlgG [Candidatus Margulisbacteria bacterium GWE2_39_32]PZM82012.1 MAG: flagellar basal-body rod protein FlgG [Candidatus Margulisiibacteriota bacterium]HCY35867.1 flagellar basal-body rod protein FlgG [Candidatus Margulisiibacteriota bacterium]